MNIYVLGIDVGKNVFNLVGLDQRGQIVVRKKLSRTQLLVYVFSRYFHRSQRQPSPHNGW